MSGRRKLMMVAMLGCFIIVAMVTESLAEQDFCKKRESCDSKTDKYSFQMNCGCDKSCIAIGDCCSDSPYNNFARKGLPTRPECVSTFLITSTSGGIIGSGNSIAIVKSCPADFDDGFIKKRCESLQDSFPVSPGNIANDFSLYVAVLGKSSHVIFANVFCAICNGESKSSFLHVDFQSRGPITIQNFLKIKDLKNFDTVFPRVTVTMSHEDYTPRPCRNHVDECHNTWPEDEVAKLCREGTTSYVYTRANFATYKNKYCAICNYMTEGNRTCRDARDYLGQAQSIPLYPYSLLFDLNTGMIVSKRRTRQALEVTAMRQKEKDCQHHEIYDPFHRNCINLYCPDQTNECEYFKNLHHDTDLSGNQLSLNEWRRMIGGLWDFLNKKIFQ